MCSLPSVSYINFVYLFVLVAKSAITEPSLLQISMFSSRQSLQYSTLKMDARPHLQNQFPPLILSKHDYWSTFSVIHLMHFDSFRRIFVEIG